MMHAIPISRLILAASLLVSPIAAMGTTTAGQRPTLRNFWLRPGLALRCRRSAMAHKIAIIVGSLREGSINRKVARSICALRGDNLDCSMVEIGDLPLYNQDRDANPPEQWV